MHELPTGFMSGAVERHLRKVAGDFLKYDGKNNFALWKTYMRIQLDNHWLKTRRLKSLAVAT